jgi:hypothetical protein
MLSTMNFLKTKTNHMKKILTNLLITLFPIMAGVSLANERYIDSAIFATITIIVIIIDKIKKD